MDTSNNKFPGKPWQTPFNELMKELEGVSPKTLSDTLKVLEREKLIKGDIQRNTSQSRIHTNRRWN